MFENAEIGIDDLPQAENVGRQHMDPGLVRRQFARPPCPGPARLASANRERCLDSIPKDGLLLR